MSDETTPLDNVRAVLAPHAERFVSKEAADQVAHLMAAQFGKADAAVLGPAIEATIGSPSYAHFFRPAAAPDPYSVEAMGQRIRADLRESGGHRNVVGKTEDGRDIIDFAGRQRSAIPLAGGPEDRANSAAQLADMERQSGKPLSQMTPDEVFSALAAQVRASKVSTSGLILKPRN